MKNTLIFILLCMGMAACSGRKDQNPSAAAKEPINEMSVAVATIVSSNSLAIGTNTLSLEALTAYISTHSDSIDAVLVRPESGGIIISEKYPMLYSRLTELRQPVIIDDKGFSDDSFTKEAGKEGTYKVSISSDALSRIGRKNKPKQTEVKTGLEWSTKTESYELYRTELGIKGSDRKNSIWIIHESSDEANSDSTGIYIKREL